jgi:2-polyprenyl-3-methyl-5-hydroxy-6-metoxy-1,4-benzoquinol methylase
MIKDNTDASWERFGREDPYYAVLTHPRFRKAALNEELRAEFFDSGRLHVEKVLATAERHFGAAAGRAAALDFGCGVGRLVIPLSRYFSKVTGVDISASMLEEAQRNCAAREVVNAEFVQSDDELSRIRGEYDFIHSVIVMQHIPVSRGYRIIERLLAHLSTNGIVALHFPIARRASIVRKAVYLLRTWFAPLNVAINVMQGKRWNEPLMQMNTYDLGRVLTTLHQNQVRSVFVEMYEAAGYLEIFVFGKKESGASTAQESPALAVHGADR